MYWFAAFSLLLMLCSRLDLSTSQALGTSNNNDSPTVDPDTPRWTHHAVLDREGKVHLFWLPGVEEIVFEVNFETKGWVGLGFSPDGNMPNSDMVVGWVINNEPTLQDRYASGRSIPEMDTQQDYKLLKGYETDTHTILRFSRKYNTCDEKDRPITNDTMRVIYAYHLDDPVDGSLMKHQKAGSRSLFLVGFNDVIADLPPNSQTFEMRVPNITLPLAEKSFCWRKIFKYTPATSNDVVIGFQPIWKMDLAGAIDHIWLYQCDVSASTTNWDQYAGEKGHKCYSADTPSEYSNCTRILASAAVGSMSTKVPPKSGYSFAQKDGQSVYFMLEVAYNDWKTQGTDEIHDSSGLSLIYTSEVVPYKSGTLTVGHVQGMSQIIPLDQFAFSSMGYCDSECTKKGLPQDGIYVYEVFIQSKIHGKEIVLRHVRNGTELAPIAKDVMYDPKAQVYRVFMDPIHVLPGDNFILECTYDTKQAQTTILGGTAEDSEACQAFLNYFPQAELQTCTSSPPLSKLYQWLGTKQAVGVEPATYQELANQTSNQKFVELLKYYNWAARGTEFQNIMREDYTSLCMSQGQENGTVSEPRRPTKISNPFYVHDACSGQTPGVGTIMESNNTMDKPESPFPAWPNEHGHENHDPMLSDHGTNDGNHDPNMPNNNDPTLTSHVDPNMTGHDPNMPHDGNNTIEESQTGETTAKPGSGFANVEGSLTMIFVAVLSVVLLRP